MRILNDSGKKLLGLFPFLPGEIHRKILGEGADQLTFQSTFEFPYEGGKKTFKTTVILQDSAEKAVLVSVHLPPSDLTSDIRKSIGNYFSSFWALLTLQDNGS